MQSINPGAEIHWSGEDKETIPRSTDCIQGAQQNFYEMTVLNKSTKVPEFVEKGSFTQIINLLEYQGKRSWRMHFSWESLEELGM